MLKRLLSFALVASLAACGQPSNQADSDSASADSSDPNTLVLLAGSEVKDMTPLLAQLKAETGVNVVLEYSGTLDGIERITAGEAVDGAWFSHAKYMMLIPEAASKVKASEKIMLSPVVMGVKESKAKQFGWGANTTWGDIANQAKAGQFKFAMTNPTSSNSGFSALVGVAASFAGKSDALEESDIDNAKMATLFKGQALTSGSSGWLADRYVQEQDTLDGIVNYESVLLSMNSEGKLKEKLTLIYPRDGMLTADYPLILLNDGKRAAYEKVVAWLKSDKAQTWLMTNTLRRPVNPAVTADKGIFGDTMLVDLSFPGKLSVVNTLLHSYLGEQRLPSSTYFVLDVSGSMSGDRIEALRKALRGLSGKEGRSLTSAFAQFQPRERITLIPFSDEVKSSSSLRVEVDPDKPQEALDKVAAYADTLTADGGTAMYDGLTAAYSQIAEDQAKSPGRYYTVVVMTDGVSNEGATMSDFQTWLAGQAPEVRKVKTFSVLFGDGDKAQLKSVADQTGGKFFDSSKVSLTTMFKEIRGYQ